jgi:hypothetical protein
MEPEEFSNNVYKTLAVRINEYAERGEEPEHSSILNEFSGDKSAEDMAAAVFFNNEEYSDNERTLYQLIYTVKKNRLESQKKAETDPRKLKELIDKEKQLAADKERWMSDI